jgi:P-type Cu+ transporter
MADGRCGRVELSRAMMRTIRQKLLFAFVYNIMEIPVAAGALYAQSGCCSTR